MLERLLVVPEKKCSRCKESKPEGAFTSDRNRRDGLHPYCKACACVFQRKYRKKNRDWLNRKERERHFRRKYGLEPAEYAVLMENASCGICGTVDDLCVDHCHDSGKVRGVLCRGCNGGVGILGDTPEALQRAVDYLVARDES